MQSGKIMQFWSAEAAGFMADATEYSDFHQKLTETLLPYLPKDGHICDAGCGLAALGRELSAHCARVTAIDSSEIAVTAAKRKPLPENMEVLCADLHQVKQTFDAMIFCYFGRIWEILDIAEKNCRGKVIIIKRSCTEHHFSLSKPTRSYAPDMTRQTLDALAIPCLQRHLSLEFGQPFRSVDDAVAFFRLYDRGTEPVTAERVLSRLQPVSHPFYRYYLSERREMELFVLDTADVRAGQKDADTAALT